MIVAYNEGMFRAVVDSPLKSCENYIENNDTGSDATEVFRGGCPMCISESVLHIEFKTTSQFPDAVGKSVPHFL
jgi:hypothetical protein